MSNQEARKEAIKAAYGNYWKFLMNYVNDEGWVQGGFIPKII